MSADCPDLRIIPCLLLRRSGFVKTVRFQAPKYLGDPVNIVRIFNEKEVDEVCILDIGVGPEGQGPRLDVIGRIAEECFMPASYGGGLRGLEDARKVFAAGFEKVVFNTAAADSPEVIAETAAVFGSQSVIAGIDVDAEGRVRVDGGSRPLAVDPVDHARRLVDQGAGEILLTAIDRDGTMAGYDLDLVKRVADAVPVPLIACGGARDVDDLVAAIQQGGAAAAAAGSLFVFYGKLRAVLVNPPPFETVCQAWRQATGQT